MVVVERRGFCIIFSLVGGAFLDKSNYMYFMSAGFQISGYFAWICLPVKIKSYL